MSLQWIYVVHQLSPTVLLLAILTQHSLNLGQDLIFLSTRSIFELYSLLEQNSYELLVLPIGLEHAICQIQIDSTTDEHQPWHESKPESIHPG